jgi:hypothetical protein
MMGILEATVGQACLGEMCYGWEMLGKAGYTFECDLRFQKQ